jgi:hypothetical protein
MLLLGIIQILAQIGYKKLQTQQKHSTISHQPLKIDTLQRMLEPQIKTLRKQLKLHHLSSIKIQIKFSKMDMI